MSAEESSPEASPDPPSTRNALAQCGTLPCWYKSENRRRSKGRQRRSNIAYILWRITSSAYFTFARMLKPLLRRRSMPSLSIRSMIMQCTEPEGDQNDDLDGRGRRHVGWTERSHSILHYSQPHRESHPLPFLSSSFDLPSANGLLSHSFWERIPFFLPSVESSLLAIFIL